MGHIYTATKPEPLLTNILPMTTDIKIDPAAMERFRKTARRGAFPGAAGGEKIANRLAKALHAIGDDLALLDPENLDGAISLMRCMSGPWPTDKFREVVFNTARSAAGK